MNAGTARIVDPSTAGGVGNSLFATDSTGTTQITNGDIEQVLGAGTALMLQANTDLTVNAAVNVSAGGSGGNLTLQAGRSVLINADITTDNGELIITANDTGAVGANRNAGSAEIIMATGTTLDAGTNNITLDISFQGDSGNMVVDNLVADDMFLRINGIGAGSSILRAGATSLISGNSLFIDHDPFGGPGGGSVGTLAEPLRIQLNNFGAHTHATSPGIFIDSLQNVSIGGSFFGGFHIIQGLETVTDGDVVLNVDGTVTTAAGPLACGGGGGPICAANGNIVLTTDDLIHNSVIDALAGDVTIKPFSAFEDINIGGVGDLDLSTAELQNITAQTLIIGVLASSTTVALSADLTSTDINANTLLLRGSSIDITGGLNFVADGENLTLDSFSTIDIDGSGGTPHSIALGTGDFSVTGQPDFALVAGPNPNESFSISADVINLDVFDYFQGSGAGANAFTELSATGDLTINTAGGDFYLWAGGINGRAVIFGNNSMIMSGGDIDLIAGTGASGNVADARIVNNSGTQLVDAAGTLTLTGGSNYGFAEIDNTSGTSQTINANDLIIELPVGGNANFSGARIDGNQQTVTVTNLLLIENSNSNAADTRTGIFGFGSLQDITAGYIEIFNESQFGAAIQQLGAGPQTINTTGQNGSGEGLHIEDNGSGTDGFAGIFCQNESGALCSGQSVTITDADYVRIISNSAASPFGASIVTSSNPAVSSSVLIHGSGLNALEIGTPTGASHAGISNTAGPTFSVTVGDPGETGSITIHGGSLGGPFSGGIGSGGLGATSQTVTVQDSIIINGSTAPAGSPPAVIRTSGGNQVVTVENGGITMVAGNGTSGTHDVFISQTGAGAFTQTVSTTGTIQITGGSDYGLAQIINTAGTTQSIIADELILEMPAAGAGNMSAATVSGNDQNLNISNGLIIDNANPNAADLATGVIGAGVMQDVTAGFIEIRNNSSVGTGIAQGGPGQQNITTTGKNASGEGLLIENTSVTTTNGFTGILCAGPDDGAACSGQQISVNDADYVRIIGYKIPENADRGTGIELGGWSVNNANVQTILIQGSGMNILELGSASTGGEAGIDSVGASQTITVGNVGQNGSIIIRGNDSVEFVANGIFAGDPGNVATTQTVTAQGEISIAGRSTGGNTITGIGAVGVQSVTSVNGDIAVTAGTGSIAGNHDAIIEQFDPGFTQNVSAVNGSIIITGGQDYGNASIDNTNGTTQTITAHDLIMNTPTIGAANQSSARIDGNQQTITVSNGLSINSANPNAIDIRSGIFSFGTTQDITAGYIWILNETNTGAEISKIGPGTQNINTTGQNGLGEGLHIEDNGSGIDSFAGIDCVNDGATFLCDTQQVTVMDADFVRILGNNSAGIYAGLPAGGAGTPGAITQTVLIEGSGQNRLELETFAATGYAYIENDSGDQILMVGNPGELGSLHVQGGSGDDSYAGISNGVSTSLGDQTVTVQGDIIITAGNAPASSFMGIEAFGGTQIIAADTINLTSGSNTVTGMGNVAYIGQFGAGFDQIITLNNGGDLILNAGDGVDNNYAVVQNLGGDVTVQTGTGAGTSDIIINAGGGANSFNNYAAIEALDPIASDILININGDLMLSAGSEASSTDAFTEIVANNGNIMATVGGNVHLQGGAGIDSQAGLDTEFQISLDVGNDLSFSGGTGIDAGAIVSAQTVLVDAGGNITITGGTGVSADVGIGADDVPVVIVLGNTVPIGGDISINGGSATGIAGLGTLCAAPSCNADITVDTLGSLSLQSGSGSPAFIGSLTQDPGIININASAIDLGDGVLKTNDNVFLNVFNTTGDITQSSVGIINIGINSLSVVTGGGDVSLLGTGNVIGNLITNIGACGSLTLFNTGLSQLGNTAICGGFSLTSTNGIDITTPLALGTGVTLDAGMGTVDISGSGSLTAGGDVILSGADIFLNATGITDISAPGFNVTINSTDEVTNFGATGGIPDVLASSLIVNAVNGVELDIGVDTVDVTNTTAGNVLLIDTNTGLTADIINTGRAITLDSTSGSIAAGVIDGSSVDIQSGSVISDANGGAANITATNFTYTAPDGFGTFTDPLETQISNSFLIANSNGDIGISQTGDLDLTGNTSASGNVYLSASNSLNVINATLGGNDVQLSGSNIQIDAAAGSAQVSAGNNLSIMNGGAVLVQGSNTNSGGSAKLLAGNTLIIDADNVTIRGGDADFAFAQIDPVSVDMTLTGDLTIEGGAGAQSGAMLAGDMIDIVSGGNVNLTGGAGDDAYAVIDAVTGNVNIEAATVALEGGTGTNTDAVIVANQGAGNVGLISTACNNCDPLEMDPFIDPETQSGVFGNLANPSTDVPDNEQVIVLESFTDELDEGDDFLNAPDAELQSDDDDEEEEEILECRA